MRAWIAGVLVVVVAACGSDSGSDSAAPSATRSDGSTTSTTIDVETTAADIARAAQAAGVGCDDLVPEEPSEQMGVKPREEATCTLAGDEAEISIYRDEGERENAFGVGKAIACPFAKEFGFQHLYLVVDDNWIIAMDSETGMNQAADALDADAETIDC